MKALLIILALTVGGGVRETKVLYQNSGDMQPQAQVVANISIKKDNTVHLEAKGNGRGDLDCYLLQYNTNIKGWTVATSDTSNMDQCHLTYTSTADRPLRVWVVNHGVHPTTYTVKVWQ